MANLTLVIDDDVLRRARVLAVQQGTSVNAVVRDHLARYAGSGSVRAAGARFVAITADANGDSGPHGHGWTRDELHQR